jgi:hypothetical protein
MEKIKKKNRRRGEWKRGEGGVGSRFLHFLKSNSIYYIIILSS